MILGAFGNVGSFKTCIITLISLIYLKAGIPVYANYTIDFPRYSHLIHKLSLSELLELRIDRGLILVDEVYTVAESRISTSKLNRFFSYFVFQSRKMHVDIIYTSQLTSAVDKRLFNLTDKKLACFGSQSNKTVKFLLNQDHNGKQKKHTFSINLEVFRDVVFNHYDTYESVDPLGIKDLIIDIERFDPVKLNQRVDDAILNLKRFYPRLINPRVKKYEIEDAILRLGEASSLASLVCNRIKSNLEPIIDNTKKTIFQKIQERKRL